MLDSILDRLTDAAIYAGGAVAYAPVAFFGWLWFWGVWAICYAVFTLGCPVKAAPLPFARIPPQPVVEMPITALSWSASGQSRLWRRSGSRWTKFWPKGGGGEWCDDPDCEACKGYVYGLKKGRGK